MGQVWKPKGSHRPGESKLLWGWNEVASLFALFQLISIVFDHFPQAMMTLRLFPFISSLPLKAIQAQGEIKIIIKVRGILVTPTY